MRHDTFAGLLHVIALRVAGRVPAWKILADAETARGFTIVRVGSVPWLPAADWHANDCVSLAGKDVRIVAVAARRPRTGALGRLVAGITAAGLQPVVICPFPDTKAILTKWGWRGRHVGDSFETREEQWRPK